MGSRSKDGTVVSQLLFPGRTGSPWLGGPGEGCVCCCWERRAQGVRGSEGLLPRVSLCPLLLFQGYHRSNHFIATQGTWHLCPCAPYALCAECPLPPFCLLCPSAASLPASLLSVWLRPALWLGHLEINHQCLFPFMSPWCAQSVCSS